MPEQPAHHAFPWKRVVSIVVVMAIGISALWAVIRHFDDTDVITSDPSPSVTSPEAEGSPPSTPDAGTPASDATPDDDADPEWPAGSLPDMLQIAPDRLADGSLPLNDVARYADIAGWMNASGIPVPASLDDPALPAWEAELDTLALPVSLRERGLDPVWRSTYGFDLTQVAQVLIVGQAPDYVTILRGTFDPNELQTAWVTSGYQAVELEGHTIWSLFPGDQIDLSAQESRPAMGTLNNIVLLEDGTLVAAARISQLGSVLRVIDGNAQSLAENDDIAALLVPGTGIDQLASAVISKGLLVQANTASLPVAVSTPLDASAGVATPASGSRMPEVNLVVLGIPIEDAVSPATPTIAGTPATMSIFLVYEGEDEGRTARRDIAKRLTADRSPVTARPYRDRLANPETSVIVTDARTLVLVEGQLVDGVSDWLAMLGDRDLGFAAWLPEP